MFDDSYEVILADTPATRTIHHKIRYRVYCLERGYEDPSAFLSGEERDQWDPDAVHFVVRERHSGRCVASMRLVLPRAVDFPVEALGCLSPAVVSGLPRRQLAEISRICMVRQSDDCTTNVRMLDHGMGQVPRAKEFEVLLGMLRAIGVYGREHRIQYCYLLVTDSFARLLRRLGVRLYQVGNAVDYRGYRTPYLASLEECAVSMSARSPSVRDFLRRDSLGYRSSGEIDEDTIDSDSLLIEPAFAAA